MTFDREVRQLASELESLSASKALGRPMRLALKRGNEEFARWCGLELPGYSTGNPAMSEEVTVPQ